MSKIYLVDSLKTTISINVMGKEKQLSCNGLADGCVGISLWFDSEKSAKKYGGKKAYLLTATVISKPDKE